MGVHTADILYTRRLKNLHALVSARKTGFVSVFDRRSDHSTTRNLFHTVQIEHAPFRRLLARPACLPHAVGFSFVKSWRRFFNQKIGAGSVSAPSAKIAAAIDDLRKLGLLDLLLNYPELGSSAAKRA